MPVCVNVALDVEGFAVEARSPQRIGERPERLGCGVDSGGLSERRHGVDRPSLGEANAPQRDQRRRIVGACGEGRLTLVGGLLTAIRLKVISGEAGACPQARFGIARARRGERLRHQLDGAVELTPSQRRCAARTYDW